MTKIRKGLPFIKFELPKPTKPVDKQPLSPGKLPADKATTLAVGEEGGARKPPGSSFEPPPATTMAVGEEGSAKPPPATTMAVGEEGAAKPGPGTFTTLATGEEGGHK